MRLGVGRLMENYLDLDRTDRHEADRPPAVSDAQVYSEELSLADLAEPLGFDSIWTTDHYFAPYQMTGSALQQATYMAGRTNRVDFGTMVITLPWHHPLQVATEICTLDNMLGGRHLTLGLGRGSSPKEFRSWGVDMGEASGRFLESVEILRRALLNEWFSFDGQFYQIPDTTIRPRPRNPQRLVDDMRCAWQSPAGLALGAEAGMEVLTFGSKTWEEYQRDIHDFNAIRERDGREPSRPVVLAWVACSEDDEEGRRLVTTHLNEFLSSNTRHYRWADAAPFERATGYEYYAEQARRRADPVAATSNATSYPETQIWGTPERCLSRLREIQDWLNVREVICCFKYGSMPYATARRSMELFAEKVVPEVRRWEAAGVAAPA